MEKNNYISIETERKINTVASEISSALKNDLAKLDPDREDLIDSHVFGNFAVTTSSSGDEMYVTLTLSNDSNYVDGLYEAFGLEYTSSDEDECEIVAKRIANYICWISDGLFFEVFQCYKDQTGRIWQLEAVDERYEMNDFECTLVSIGEADEDVIYASMDQEANSIRYYSEDVDDYVNIYPDARVDLTHAA